MRAQSEGKSAHAVEQLSAELYMRAGDRGHKLSAHEVDQVHHIQSWLNNTPQVGIRFRLLSNL